MRISAKSDYAVRAMAELAAGGEHGAVKAEQIALAQDIPLNFLLGILRELRNAHLVRSQRGREGGYVLSRPSTEITLADVIRAVDGPLANVRDLSLTDLSYPGAAESLRDVWMAVRGSLRDTDLACDFGQQGASFGVILAGTPLEGAKLVEAKLERAVRRELPDGLANIPIGFVTRRIDPPEPEPPNPEPPSATGQRAEETAG